MHNPESTLENETPMIFWDFEILTDRLIPVRRPDQEIIDNNSNKKENLPYSGLYWPSEPLGENQITQNERQVLKLCHWKKSGTRENR